MILTSPYVRTISTANAIAAAVKKLTGISVPVEIDRNISEYMPRRPSLSPATRAYSPPSNENSVSLTKRLGNHLRSVERRKGDVWIVTHGLILNQLAHLMGLELPNYPKYLDHLVIEGNKRSFYRWRMTSSYNKLR